MKIPLRRRPPTHNLTDSTRRSAGSANIGPILNTWISALLTTLCNVNQVTLHVSPQPKRRHLKQTCERWRLAGETGKYFQGGSLEEAVESLKEFTLETWKYGLATLVVFPCWLRYAELQLHAMYTMRWRHGARTVPRINIGHMFKERTFWNFICIIYS